MKTRIQTCLEGTEKNYLYPFFQVREKDPQKYVEELEAVRNAGCRGILVEIRENYQFNDELWTVLDTMMETSEKLGIKIWLTDDICVASGSANHTVTDHPELVRKNVAMEVVDIMGPAPETCYDFRGMLGEGEYITAAVAYRVDDADGELVYSSPKNLTKYVENNRLFWNVPDGFWRIFVIVHTQTREAMYYDYVDFLNPDSCHLMIDNVYEVFYDRYKKYIGTSWEGLFTDEPFFGNSFERRMLFNQKLGTEGVVLPWRADVPEIIAREEGWTYDEAICALPGLWKEIGGKTQSVRRRYMDILTREYSENFVKLLGKWCTDHDIFYTGHIVEDMDAHMRLGYSTGHMFRSQEGQHSAGFDLVLQQTRLGSRSIPHATVSSAKYSDPKFYLYVLGRLVSSIAHAYPHMKGRVMCENAGAGGWNLGLSSRKYDLDAMTVGGGNLVVPVEFDPIRREEGKLYAPFMYEHGENPQYPFTRPLMEYLNRMCHLFSEGTHRANALIYYPAEGDWAGYIKPTQATATPLALAHVDYDYASFDILNSDMLVIKDGKLSVNKETFDALVIPSCDYLPKEILDRFEEIAKEVPVIFADRTPFVSETHERYETKSAICMSETEIPEWFKAKGFYDFKLDGAEDIIHLHMSHPEEETETYLFFNLSAKDSVDAVAEFKYTGDYTIYDAWTNKVIARHTDDGKVRLAIAPKATLIVQFGKPVGNDGDAFIPGELDGLDWKPIDNNTVFTLDMNNTKTGEVFPTREIKADALTNLAREYPEFAGALVYTANLEIPKGVKYIDLGLVGEVASVTVNGKSCGSLVSSPFRYRIDGAVREGENKIQITVASNFGYAKKPDRYSKFIPLPPTGLLGPICFA